MCCVCGYGLDLEIFIAQWAWFKYIVEFMCVFFSLSLLPSFSLLLLIWQHIYSLRRILRHKTYIHTNIHKHVVACHRTQQIARIFVRILNHIMRTQAGNVLIKYSIHWNWRRVYRIKKSKRAKCTTLWKYNRRYYGSIQNIKASQA